MPTSQLHLPDQPTLPDFQTYLRHMVAERGFQNTNEEVFMRFLEEAGEMSKAARIHDKAVRSQTTPPPYDLHHEVADVFIYLLDICNRYHIDLEDAFRRKEEINKQRAWS